MCSQTRAQSKQWKRYGTRPTALSNVDALRISSKRIQPRVVWIVQVTPSCWGNAGVLKNMLCSMCWQPFFLLFLDTNGAIPVPTISTAIRTTTPFSCQLTFTPSNDSFPGFFQLSWWWLLQWYTHLHCFSACASWPTVWILTMVRTWLTLINSFWPAATLSMIDQSSTPHTPSAMLQLTCQQHPRCPYCRQLWLKRHTLSSARVWPFSELLRSPFSFLLDFDLRETFFRRPPSRVPFFRRIQYCPFLDGSNAVWSLGDFRHNLHIFAWRFIFVRSLQSSSDVVWYGSVLFSVSVLCSMMCKMFINNRKS